MNFKNVGELRSYLLRKEKERKTFPEIAVTSEQLHKIRESIEQTIYKISRKKKVIDFLSENDDKYLPLILADISSLKKELYSFLDEYSEKYKEYDELCQKYNINNNFVKNPLEFIVIYSQKY